MILCSFILESTTDNTDPLKKLPKKEMILSKESGVHVVKKHVGGIDHHAIHYPILQPAARLTGDASKMELVPWKESPGEIHFDLVQSNQNSRKHHTEGDGQGEDDHRVLARATVSVSALVKSNEEQTLSLPLVPFLASHAMHKKNLNLATGQLRIRLMLDRKHDQRTKHRRRKNKKNPNHTTTNVEQPRWCMRRYSNFIAEALKNSKDGVVVTSGLFGFFVS